MINNSVTIHLMWILLQTLLILSKSSQQQSQVNLTNRCLFTECTCSIQQPQQQQQQLSSKPSLILYGQLNVKCTPPSGHQQPQRDPRLVTPAIISSLELSNYNMSQLPNDDNSSTPMFAQLVIGELSLVNNSIRTLGATAFAGVRHVATLRIIESRGQLTSIDPATFRPLALTLRTLQLTSNLSDDTFVSLLASLEPLEFVSELNLDGNRLTALDARLSSLMPAVRTLVLTNNQIKHLGADAFRHFKSLVDLSLDHNKIDDLDELVHVTLDKPVRNSLERLSLSDNLVDELIDFPPFARLVYLSLARNRVSHVAAHHLRSLVLLQTLDLTANSIELIESGSFASLFMLQTLALGANRLVRVPDLLALVNLKYLQLGWNALTFVDELAFEHGAVVMTTMVMRPLWPLTIYLDANPPTLEFSPRAFCSQFYPYVQQLQELVLSMAAAMNFDKCHFKQLAADPRITQKTLTILPSTSSSSSISSVCNCKFVKFAAAYGFRVGGVCDDFDVGVSCAVDDSFSFHHDDCSKEFDCETKSASSNQTAVTTQSSSLTNNLSIHTSTISSSTVLDTTTLKSSNVSSVNTTSTARSTTKTTKTTSSAPISSTMSDSTKKTN